MSIMNMSHFAAGIMRRDSHDQHKFCHRAAERLFLSDGTKDISFRMDALRKLKSAIKAHEQDILDAL